MDKLKCTLVALFSGFMSLLGVLAIPVILLVSCNVIDYITGLMASKYRNQTIDSYKGIKGIAKKICMWLLVIVGFITDNLLSYASVSVGIVLPFNFLIACIVAIWLVCNELISILENVSDIGVNLPPFLKPLLKNIKTQVEDKTKINKEV